MVFVERMTENYSNVADTNLQIQKTEQTPHRINPKKFTPRHMVIKCSKTKDQKKKKKKNLPRLANIKDTFAYNETIQMTLDFSSETTETKKRWHSIF